MLSTLHTNDAPSSITRLINIGIEPFLITASVKAILAQRLVRKICQNCKTEVSEGSEREMARLEQFGLKDVKIFHGSGCDQCRNTGYKGRVGIYELLTLDDDTRNFIAKDPSLTELRHFANNKGMVSLRQDGFIKVAQGRTTIKEILRATDTD